MQAPGNVKRLDASLTERVVSASAPCVADAIQVCVRMRVAWLVRAKGHFYGDHATNPPAANTFLAQAQAADRRYNGDENPNYGNAVSNPIYSPIYNPINNAKVQERARVQAECEEMLANIDAEATAAMSFANSQQ